MGVGLVGVGLVGYFGGRRGGGVLTGVPDGFINVSTTLFITVFIAVFIQIAIFIFIICLNVCATIYRRNIRILRCWD